MTIISVQRKNDRVVDPGIGLHNQGGALDAPTRITVHYVPLKVPKTFVQRVLPRGQRTRPVARMGLPARDVRRGRHGRTTRAGAGVVPKADEPCRLPFRRRRAGHAVSA